MSLRRWVLTIASFATAIGASAYVVYTSWEAERGLAAVPITAHAMALGAFLLELLSRTLKIRLSAAALRVPVSFGAALRTCLGGDFGAAITPARSGAEPARFFVLREAGTPTSGTLLVLFAELFLELISLVVVVLGFWLTLDVSGPMGATLMGLVGGYAAFVLGVGVVAILLARRRAHGPPPKWTRRTGMHAGHWRVVQRGMRHVRAGVLAVRGARPGLMFFALVASIAHILARLLVLPAIVYSFGVQVPLAPLLLWPLALVYGSAAIPAPGGGGVIEMAFKAALGDRIPARIFGTTVIWWRFYTFYLYVLVGALAAGRTVMRALREREGEGAKKPA